MGGSEINSIAGGVAGVAWYFRLLKETAIMRKSWERGGRREGAARKIRVSQRVATVFVRDASVAGREARKGMERRRTGVRGLNGASQGKTGVVGYKVDGEKVVSKPEG